MQKVIAALQELASGQSLVFGSGDDADVVHQSAGIDRRHARFVRRDDAFHVQDLDSRTGTLLNGAEIRGLAKINPGDRVRIGDVELVIPEVINPSMQSAPQDFDTSAGKPSLTVVNATRTVSAGSRILDRISFHLDAGQFLGILGASGSGKSTLIKSLAGLVELSEGAVLLAGQTTNSLALRKNRRIAYLPQDVVIHEALTAGSALDYIARLKEISETQQQRREVVRAVLDRVGLADRMNVPIQRLSGGQRKRVALAAELLGDPQLILLDEATSGLDPATEEEMMELFRSLAQEGRTVICITHSPGRLHLCDRLLCLNGGKCIFYGTHPELCRFFAVSTIEEVYAKQAIHSTEEWEAAFRESVVGRRELALASSESANTTASVPLPADQSREILWQQGFVLASRYFRLHLSDPRNLLLLLVQAPVISLMIASTYGNIRFSFAELHAANTKEVIFLLVVSVLWCSGTMSVREIVKEIPILQHETRFGVALVPYLISKFALLGILSLIQTWALLLIVRHFTQLTGIFDLQFLVLGFLSLVGVSLGLTISAVARTSERAMTVLPVVLIGQAIFSGGLGHFAGFIRVAAMLFSPADWSLDGLRALFSPDLRNATYPGAPGHFQPPILGPGGPLLGDLLALTMQALVLLVFTWLALKVVIGQLTMTRGLYEIRTVVTGRWKWLLTMVHPHTADLADS
jgi:ABC-type multidrug transport system ATPase subunit